MSSIIQLNEDIIGIDKNRTITVYIIQDKITNITTNDCIIQCLQNLGYENINMSDKFRSFL